MRTDELLLIKEVRGRLKDGTARVLRMRAGLTQTEVASTCRVSEATVSRWERGKRMPRTREALRYGRVLRQLEEALK